MPKNITKWDDIDQINCSDLEILKEHGLNTSLWHKLHELVPNQEELERQLRYIRDNINCIPQTTAKRRVLQILACYVQSDTLVPREILPVIGTLMDTASHQVMYAKKGTQRERAKYYMEHNPDLSNGDIANKVGVHRSTVYRWRKKTGKY